MEDALCFKIKSLVMKICLKFVILVIKEVLRNILMKWSIESSKILSIKTMAVISIVIIIQTVEYNSKISISDLFNSFFLNLTNLIYI